MLAVAWTWLLSQENWRLRMDVAKWIPAILVGFAGARCATLLHNLRVMASCLWQKESGWEVGSETYFVSGKHWPVNTKVGVAFWLALLSVFVRVAVRFNCQ